jgi:thiosulfate/3-mercaptopyruvate sulfurtransferase
MRPIMTIPRCGLAFVLALLPFSSSNAAGLLLSFEELQAKLASPDVRILDTRTKAQYDQGHIPGSVWVDTKAATELAGRPGGLRDQAAWEAWLAPLGLGPNTEVVVVDGDRQREAARVWWLLGYLGIDKVALVDGNVPLWKSRGLPLSLELPRSDPRPVPVRFRSSKLATLEQTLSALQEGGTAIVDARSAGEYTGVQKSSKRGGHIPTACHLEWLSLVDKEGRFLDESTLRSKVEALGIKPGSAVIAHCQGGGRASVDAFVFERLGHPTRNFYPGWSEWGNAEKTPVVDGSKPGEAPGKP